MTVGDYLDTAAVHLARAATLIRDRRPISANEQATVAVARVRVYRELHRQLTLVTGVEPQHWIEQVTAGDPEAGQLARFSDLLRGLTLNTDLAHQNLLPDVPVHGPVGTAVHRAAQALTSANRIIAAHLGDRDRPRTPEGAALAARYQEADNLSNTGQLVLAAIDLDHLINERRWMRPMPDSGLLQQLLLRAGQDARDASGVLHAGVAHQLTEAGVGARGFSRSLAPLPRIDHPSAWATVATAREAIAAMDAARIYLFHHGDQMTVGQIAAAVRSGLELTANLSQVLHQTRTATNHSAEGILSTVRKWSQAAHAAGELRSASHRSASPTTVPTTALRGVSTWLARKIRTEVRGLNKITDRRSAAEELGANGSDRLMSAWRQTAGQILIRLHDVADSLRTAAEAIQRNDGLLGPAEPQPHPDRLIETPRWRPVKRDDPAFRRLTNSLSGVSEDLRSLATATGVFPLPNLQDVAMASNRGARQAEHVHHQPTAGWTTGTALTPSHLPGAKPFRPRRDTLRR